MTPERRMEALCAAPAAERERLADAILRGARIEVVAGPQVATAPVRLPVPGTGSTFVAGRAVVTTCEVALDGVRGDAVVQGRAPREALAAAICDAEAERGGPCAAAVAELARAAEQQRVERLREEARAVHETRLDAEEGQP